MQRKDSYIKQVNQQVNNRLSYNEFGEEGPQYIDAIGREYIKKIQKTRGLYEKDDDIESNLTDTYRNEFWIRIPKSVKNIQLSANVGEPIVLYNIANGEMHVGSCSGLDVRSGRSKTGSMTITNFKLIDNPIDNLKKHFYDLSSKEVVNKNKKRRIQ